MTDPPQSARRRLRVSLRGLMVLVLVVGGGLGWQVYRLRSQRLAVAAIRAAGGTVLYDYQFSTDPAIRTRLRGVTEPPAPRWLRRLVGDEFFQSAASVGSDRQVTPELLAAVAQLDGLLNLHVRSATRMDDAWPILERLRRLDAITLSGPGVTDRAVVTLGKIATLRTIYLSEAAVTPAGLEPLAALSHLQYLTVHACPGLTDPGVAGFLAASPARLERFAWLMAPGPVPATMAALAEHHPGLEWLDLADGAAGDADLAPIGKLAGLTRLNLQRTRVTDAGLVHLEPLSRLQQLWINVPGVTDAGMRSVAKLLDLRFLVLNQSQVGDAGLADLAGLAKLQQLALGSTRVTDLGLPSFERFPSLENLSLVRTKLTDAGLPALEPLRKLKVLGLSGTEVTPAGLARLRAALPGCNVVRRPLGGGPSAPSPAAAGSKP